MLEPVAVTVPELEPGPVTVTVTVTVRRRLQGHELVARHPASASARCPCRSLVAFSRGCRYLAATPGLLACPPSAVAAAAAAAADSVPVVVCASLSSHVGAPSHLLAAHRPRLGRAHRLTPITAVPDLGPVASW